MAAQPHEFRIFTMPRTRQRDLHDFPNAARSCGHRIDAIRQKHRFIDIVGDEEDRLPGFRPRSTSRCMVGV